MKKLIAIVLIAGLAVSPALAVQKSASVTTNPFSLLLGIMGVEGNFAMSDSASIPVSFGYFSASEEGLYTETEASIMQLGTGLRYYWQGKAVNGWYLGGTLTYNMVSVDYTEEAYWGNSNTEYTGSASAGALGYGFLIGYQSIWGNGFTLDTGLGAAKYTIPSVDVEVESSAGTTKTEESTEISLTLPQIKLAIGYAF